MGISHLIGVSIKDAPNVAQEARMFSAASGSDSLP